MHKTHDSAIGEFKELVKEFDTAMMTTISSDGHMHSRPMATQKPMDNSPIWFVSSVDTEKARELDQDSRVNLAYFRSKDMAWVSVAGKVHIEQNAALIKALWQPDWKIYFPNGPESPDLAILHVDPEHVTFWKPEGGQIQTLLLMAKAFVTGTRPDFKPPTSVRP